MTEEIKKMIADNEKKNDFTYAGFDANVRKEAEKELGVVIPSQYVDFLEKYGHGGIGGVEILGVGKTGSLLFVEKTKSMRMHGLPEELIVIEDCDEWLYCLDSKTESVVSWDGADILQEYATFDSYLTDRFREAVDNM